jgi:cytoskeletal protein CcmA (bactofilin family)
MLREVLVEDLTEHGASLRSEQPVKKGWLVKMTLPIGTTRVAVQGRIVRHRTERADGSVSHIHRVEFTTFDSSPLQPVAIVTSPPVPEPTTHALPDIRPSDLLPRSQLMTTRNAFTAGDARATSANSLLAVLGGSARIEGRFEIEESIEIQCDVSGELEVGGTLTIGEHGQVSADVSTVNAVIHGRYEGDLKASGSVEIAATAQVTGSIQANEIAIARGAVFTGSISRIETAEVAEAQHASVASQTPATVVFDAERQVPMARLPLVDVGNRPARGQIELT